MAMVPEDKAETAEWERLKRQLPMPNEGNRRGASAAAAPPVGVRDGDVLVIGVGNEGMSDAEREWLRTQLRETAGVDVWILPVPGTGGVTVLRPER